MVDFLAVHAGGAIVSLLRLSVRDDDDSTAVASGEVMGIVREGDVCYGVVLSESSWSD